MKFVLEIDLGDDAMGGRALDEIGRILRYWAGNLRHYPLEVGTTEVVSDTAYAPVGSWRFEE